MFSDLYYQSESSPGHQLSDSFLRDSSTYSKHSYFKSMSKSQFYLSQCAEAASKSPMCFSLGAILVKGGKVISSGYNHHRTHYDGGEASRRGSGPGHRKPVSMHAEMHAIFNATDGWTPAFKHQVSAKNKGGKKDKEVPAPSSSLLTSRSTTGQSQSYNNSSQSQSPPESTPPSSSSTTSSTSFKTTREKPQCLSAGPRPQDLQEQISTTNQKEQSTSLSQCCQQLWLVDGGCGPRFGNYFQQQRTQQQQGEQCHSSSSTFYFAFPLGLPAAASVAA
jgi:hypothetical protein